MAPRARLLRPRRGPGLSRARRLRARHRPARTGLRGRPAPRSATVSRISERRRARDEIDDIFADDEPRRAGARALRPVGGNGGADVQVHLVTPDSFNDAQEVADHFKQRRPGDPQPADHRRRARQAADRLRLRAHLRARRRDAEDRRQDLPAHARATSRSRPRRRRASSRRASSTSLVTPPGSPRAAVRRYARSAAGRARMRIGFAGAGNMAAAMARGWAAAGRGPEAMLFCDLDGRARRGAGRRGRRRDASSARASSPGRRRRCCWRSSRPPSRRSPRSSAAGADAIVSVLAATPLGRLRERFPGVPVAAR